MVTDGVRVGRGRRYRWELAPPRESSVPGGLCLSPLLLHILANRGITSAAQISAYLHPAAQPLADPHTMAGLPEAVTRLCRALDGRELTGIYGDYDVDGLTATAVLASALERLGGSVLPFIPHRVRDGYGLRDGPLAALREAGARLAVSVDCGVTARDEVARAREAGLEVIVTDHHLVPQELPRTAVLNPRRQDCGYPFKELAGVGVAFRLAEALLRERLPGREADDEVEQLLDLVAIGTLADSMPLTGENRTLVARGVRQLGRTARPGLVALLERLGGGDSPSAERICFGLVPRLNAPGRLDEARQALDLLLTDEPLEARRLAHRLDELNRERQTLTQAALEVARGQLETVGLKPAVVLVGDFPAGILGLLAARLAEALARPTIVLRRDGELCSGSARSIAGVDVVGAIARGAQHLERFGGHSMAAGLTLRAERLKDFESEFLDAVAEVRGQVPPERELVLDAELPARDASTWATLEVLEMLEPCGSGNPPPTFLTRGLRVADVRARAHGVSALKLAADGVVLPAVSFGRSGEPPRLGEWIDAAYRLKRREWRGLISAEAELLDWRPGAVPASS